VPKPVVTTEQAIVDIAEQAGFIAEDNPEAAERSIAVVRATIASLGDKPTRGGSYKTGHPKLKGLRRLVVPRFNNYLIFYFDLKDKVRVISVIHGARDIPSILSEVSYE
jgi:toxin ParE1/3/4